MFNLFNRARKSLRAIGLIGALFALSACDETLGSATGGGALESDGAVKVALLLPYGSSGVGDVSLARSLENAARLAGNDLGEGTVEIKVYSTAGQAGRAAAVADQAIAEGAQIIVGPLRSDTANAAAVAARDNGVNVLAFSNNESIAGGNLFILGNTFGNIADRLMNYSSAAGRTKVVVVHPRTPAGTAARDALTRAAASSNVQIVGDGAFEFSAEGISSAAPRISRSVRETGATGVVLTDDSAGALPFLAQVLPEQGISPSQVKYMGLARWDVPVQTLNLPALQGGWFALPDPGLSQQFNNRYQATYGSAPHPLAGLAYDGIAAVGALVRNNRDLSAGNLTQSAGFAGVNGVFRFRSNGTNERALAVAQVTNNQVQIIDPAPKSFGRAGS